MSRYIQKIIKDIKQDVTLSGNSVIVSNTHAIDGHQVAPFVPGTVNNLTGYDVTGGTNFDIGGTTDYPVTTGDIGTPGSPPYNYDVVSPSHESVTIATVKRFYREAIRDYSQENLDYLEESGAKVYAKFDDETEVEVFWSEVFNPRNATSTSSFNIAEIAAANNQHFWIDTNGAHVTSDLRRSWDDEYAEPNHGTLATPTLQNPWHNILINSLGILLRKGLINLAALESGSIAFYDGTGNNASNINAVFGSQGAQIGKSTEKHLVLDNTGLNAYDENGELAPVRASNIAADHADIETLKTGKADIDYLTTNYALIDDLDASNARIQTLSTIILSAVNADIDNLTADEIAATNISALNAALAHIEAGSATIQDLNTVNAFIEMIAANRITTNYLAANYADINLANVDTEWLDHGIIKEASISDAMIVGVSANKLTAGEIDASKIRVSNLMANNILVNMINNVPVNGATVADALMVHDNDINNINVRLDDELSALNARVDSQIETFTLSAVPTLNNQPANEWLIYLTDYNDEEVLDSNDEPILVEDLRRSHIGDIAYVSNPGNEADGYSYRFMYDNTTQTYSWTLIKDTQITDVIQRLIDAEGKIDGLETFESTTSQWIEETDQGVRTIRQNVSTLTSSLEEANQAIESKVDTTTFQEIVDEVNEQSSTITTLTTSVDTINGTIDDLATASSVTTVTNLVNQVKQTADTNSASIKSLETTTSDLYGVSDTLIERVSSLNQSLDGFDTKVSNIYSDITDTNKSLNQLKATYAICYTAANASSKTADSMLSYLIDSNGDYVLDSSNNKIELLDTLDSFILRPGNKISCTFINENTAANPTLNINGTGAKPILSYSGQSLSEDEYKWKANSTFEFIYDGSGWRLQDSGSIKRLSAAETKIDQNANAITLSATKTEVKESIDGIQIGGRNLAKVTDQILSPTEYSGLTMYLSSPLEVDEKYILQLWDVDISHSGRTNDFNLAIYYCGGSVRLITFNAEYFNEGHADYMMAEFTVTSSMVSAADVNNAGTNKFIRFYNSVPSTSGTKNLTIGKVKLEKGTKPSDWTPAPEDMQSIEQAAAELKVTNEAITAKVSKTDYTGNSVVSMINQTADDIKIQAKHVEVDGLAVFTNREFKESFDNKINELSSYVESIGTDLAGYINSNENALNSLNMLIKNQTDSQVDVWYYSGEPNLTGMPYNSWLYLIDSNEQLVLDSNGNPISVEDTRAEHVGDLYFDSVTGYSYRFAKDNNTYIWDRIKDNDITGALHAAQDAQATADKKRRIFTTTPTVPYDIGDLWVNGNNVKYATVKKASTQTYSSNDWALTATDDSMAKENIKDTVRLWSFGHNRLLPDPPSQAVTTENPFVDGWSINPVSFSDLPPDVIIYYFYCDQYQKGDGSYGWSEVVYDAAITEAHQLARTVQDELSSYIIKNDLALNSLKIDLKNQTDSQVDIWYFAATPDFNNAPYNGWLYLTDSNNQTVLDGNGNPISVEDTRANHVGDLYFDTATGYSYRFDSINGTYVWTKIQDKDIGAALSAANDAQTTADNKRRIFTATPTVPYDIGDLWVNGTQVKYANKARTTGNFTNSDWVLTATDDTKANSVSDTLSEYMSSNNTALNTLQQSLQGQIDSQVDIWYYSGEPTLTNNPASSWSDTATRDKHIGDLYFDTSKGYAYRFIKSGTTYSWSRIKDSDIASALSAANTAQTTADNKRRIFTATPTVPYDIGDLWVNGDEIKYATISKTTSQTYSSSDWALTATDDTMASKGIKTRTKLWYIKSNSTPPDPPLTKVTSSSMNPSGWRTVIPDYNDNYPYYFYCYQDEKANGDITWSDVIFDKNTTNTQSASRAAAPKTTAVKRQQRIYYRSSSNVKPTAPSTWVTKTSDSYSTTYNSSSNWTTKYSQLTYNDTKYPYMWTCLQSETVSEQITNSPVLLDDSTLVIDGGNIILGSIAANKLDVEDINVAHRLTIGAFNSATQGDILNSTYITEVDNDGIKIHSKNDDVSNFNRIDGTGTAIYRGGKEIAKFGSEITLGGNSILSTLNIKNTGITIKQGSSEYASFGINTTIGSTKSKHVDIDSSSVDIYTGSTRLAHYGDEIILGDTDSQASLLNSSGMTIYKSGNEIASFGDEIVLGSTSNQGSRINSNGMQIFKGGRQVASFGNDITIGVPNNGAYTYLDNNSYRISWNKNGSFRVGYTRIAGSVITESFRVTKESDKLQFNLAYYTTYIRTLSVSGFISTNDNSRTIDGVYQGTPPSHDIYTNISTVDSYSYAYLHSRISIDLTKINQYYERDYESDFIVNIEYVISNDEIRMPYLELGEIGFTTHPVCSIISGSGNRITEYVQYSLIIGTGNSVTSGGATDPNIAVGIIGSGNIIEYDTGCTFINGRSNRINRRSNYVFINGLSNEVETYADNVFINGSYNRADGWNTFISGTDNEAQGFSSLLGWGLKTPETASYMQGALICGRDNKVVDNLVFCVGNGTYTSSTGRSNAFVLLGDGTAYINGSSSSNGNTVTSDKRIKTLIDDISPEEGNKFISSLKPRKYYKNTSNGQEKQVGFYAQDIEEDDDFGEYLVSIDNSGNYDIPDFRLLNYQGIIAPLVASVQYLQQENEQLKQKNQELENRLARLEELLLNR